jgi:UDP-N-acetylmuramoyl-tripeptide--D-alanyl-D-alanine ligase
MQHIVQVTILNDTYNANPDSTLAALATLQAMKPTGKKIAVLGDMLELGNQAKELHRQIGKTAARCGVDILLTIGTLSKSLHDAASVGTKAHFDSKSALTEYLIRTVADGDIVLVKGSRGMKMEEIIVNLSGQLSPNTGIS